MLGFPARLLSRASPGGVRKALAVAAVTAVVSYHFGACTTFFSTLSLRSRPIPFAFRIFPRWASIADSTPQRSTYPDSPVLQGGLGSSRQASGAPVSSLFSPSRGLAAAAEKGLPVWPVTMAWRSHGRSNRELVENLKRNGVFRDERVHEVMLKVCKRPCVS